MFERNRTRRTNLKRAKGVQKETALHGNRIKVAWKRNSVNAECIFRGHLFREGGGRWIRCLKCQGWAQFCNKVDATRMEMLLIPGIFINDRDLVHSVREPMNFWHFRKMLFSNACSTNISSTCLRNRFTFAGPIYPRVRTLSAQSRTVLYIRRMTQTRALDARWPLVRPNCLNAF